MAWANVVGLVLGFVGAVLLALDFLTSRTEVESVPDELPSIVTDLIVNIRRGNAKDEDLTKLIERCTALGMQGTASRSGEGHHRLRVRTAGRFGIILIVLGFLGQLVAALPLGRAAASAGPPSAATTDAGSG